MKAIYKICAGLLLFSTLQMVHGANSLNVKEGALTHLFYTPTPYVNKANTLVVGLHEISYSLDDKLQFQLSLFDNIGHIDFGAKYQMWEDISLGIGLAGTINHAHWDYDGYYYHSSSNHKRLGIYLTGDLANSAGFAAAYTLHSQIGEEVNIGADLGGIKGFGPVWSLIAEITSSLNVNHADVFFGFNGGVRIVPPPTPFLFIDLGLNALGLSTPHGIDGPSLYIDISGAFDLN